MYKIANGIYTLLWASTICKLLLNINIRLLLTITRVQLQCATFQTSIGFSNTFSYIQTVAISFITIVVCIRIVESILFQHVLIRSYIPYIDRITKLQIDFSTNKILILIFLYLMKMYVLL